MLPKNDNPNFYLHTKIPDGQTAIHLFKSLTFVCLGLREHGDCSVDCTYLNA